MIEYEHDTVNQVCVCRTDKMITEIYIEKCKGGNILFEFRFEKGNVPHDLSGKYTTVQTAQRALEKYLSNKPMSKHKRVKEYVDTIEKERNAAKLESEGSEQLHQGPNN